MNLRVRQAVGGSHKGQRSPVNEDALLRLSEVPVYAVADGMGGEGCGDVAANTALAMVKRRAPQLKQFNSSIFDDQSTKNRLSLMSFMDRVFNGASREIRQAATRLSRADMGTTLLVATVVDEFAYIAHVGNSRAYLFRDGELRRLTEDHTINELRQRRGKAVNSGPDGEVLYQCLGGSFEVEVDLAEVRVMGDDVLLLCTDGLVRALEEEVIQGLIDNSDLKESVRKLMQAAVQLGADDDVSLILLGLDDENKPANTLETVTQTLKEIFLFKKMTEQELLVIAPYLEEEVYDKGDVIVTEGEPGDSFYIIISGHVRVSRNKLHLVDIAGGGHFGEISLARPVKRSATVKALTPVRMFSFSREQFHRVICNKPDLGAKMALHLLDAVGDRVRDLTNRLDKVQKAMREASKGS